MVVKDLSNHIIGLSSSAQFLLYLAEAGSDRMTLTQMAFFVLAAAEDLKGTPATRTQLLGKSGVDLRPSIRNSYRALLSPCRNYPHAVSWLEIEHNPDDQREQILRLTDIGRTVVEDALGALAPS